MKPCPSPFLALALLFASCAAMAEVKYEAPPTFTASEILKTWPELLEGPHHKVREEVPNDGYWDFYTIDSDFGVFHAHGWIDLRNTVREIEALAVLDEVTRTEVFSRSVLDAGLDPIRTASQIIAHPVETVKHVPGGIKLMFERYARKAKTILEAAGRVARGEEMKKPQDARLSEACEAGNEPWPGACDEAGYADDFKRLARRYFNVTRAQREFHEELGTDPYSSNVTLQDAIRDMAWVGGAGHFGIRQLNPLRSVKALGITGQLYRYAWRLEPFELRELMRDVLADNGVDRESALYFLNNPFMTPTKQVFIVMSLGQLEGVSGKEYLIDWAADSRNEDEALYSMATVALVAWFHTVNPLESLLPNSFLPVVRTRDGRQVALLPVDHLSWTEEVATILEAARYNENLDPGAYREVWLLARASDRARSELEARGITVIENGSEQLLATESDFEFSEFDLKPERAKDAFLEVDRLDKDD